MEPSVDGPLLKDYELWYFLVTRLGDYATIIRILCYFLVTRLGAYSQRLGAYATGLGVYAT